ncbi:MAG: choice-of-anchor A family protein, partial [Ruminiclostridium sp.]|nr:choice-of-anchor A family protein [Ruminiclostridium sp.]
MLNNSYDNYTQKPQLSAKLKVLRKIIAFVFAINMLFTRFFGGAAGTELKHTEVFVDNSASQTYVTDSVYSTSLPSILSASEFDTSVSESSSSVYNNLVGDFYNDVFGYAAGFSLFTEGDANITNADSAGRIAVGGDFNVTANGGWYTLNKDDPNLMDKSSYASLIVGGTANVKLNYGNVWANELGDFNMDCNGNVVVGGVNSEDCKFNFADTFAYLRYSSAHLASLTANGVYDGGYGTINLTGYDEGVNIFTFDIYQWNEMTSGGSFALNINVPDGSTILINITGGAGDTDTRLNLTMHTICVNNVQLNNSTIFGNL